jgi:hypothetical protein
MRSRPGRRPAALVGTRREEQTMNPSEICLERFRIAASVRIPIAHLERLPANTELRLLQDEVDHLVVKITSEIAGERLSRVEWPEDWWQAVKQRFAPSWFLRLWPVKHVVFEARALYPRLKLPPNPNMLATNVIVQLDGRPLIP